MKFWGLSKLKCNVLMRKCLLNLLLLFISPRNKFIVCLSQNLDKYIVLYQKELIATYNHKHHNPKSVKEIAA